MNDYIRLGNYKSGQNHYCYNINDPYIQHTSSIVYLITKIKYIYIYKSKSYPKTNKIKIENKTWIGSGFKVSNCLLKTVNPFFDNQRIKMENNHSESVVSVLAQFLVQADSPINK